MTAVTIDQVISELATNIENGLVSKSDLDFSESLVKNFHRKNELSVKQEYWARKMLERSVLGDAVNELPTEELGSFQGVIDMFNKAKEKLKFPKIRLVTETGKLVVLAMAGAKAKKPGSINLTDGGPWGANKWYGRVLADGVWEKTSSADDEIAKLLHNLADNAHRVAHAHGTIHGNCCFCSKKLTDPKSTAAGYGPVCAENWGLYDEWKSATNKIFEGV